MYGHPINYNPFSPHATPPTATPPDVSIEKFKAARAVGATHLSADGSKAFQTRYGTVYEADWQGETFGCWWPLESGLPADAVRLE